MFEILKDHAVKTVWCEPIQDRQFTIQPARLTMAGGVFKTVGVLWKKVKLPHYADPSFRKSYHVYQIGQIPSGTLGLDMLKDEWISLDDILHQSEAYVEVMTQKGTMTSRTETYLRKTFPDNNLIVAIMVDPNYQLGLATLYDNVTNAQYQQNFKLDNTDITVRFYTNARTHSLEHRDNTNQVLNSVDSFSQIVKDESDFYSFKSMVLTNKPTLGWVRLDGYVYSPNYLNDYKLEIAGRELSAYLDNTILTTKYFKVADLKTFTSTLNNGVEKYLLSFGPNNQIIYHNDVEYFLGKIVNGYFKGVNIPRPRLNEVNMVTHDIHSLRVDVIHDLYNANSELFNSMDELVIMSVVRQGGMVRGLQSQRTHLEYLYELTNDEVYQALQGTNSLMPEWTASYLEKDSYSKLMGVDYELMSTDLIVGAYGYNALSHLLMNMPAKFKYTRTVNNARYFEGKLAIATPSFLTKAGTTLVNHCFDSNGLFLKTIKTAYAGSLDGVISLTDSTGDIKYVECYPVTGTGRISSTAISFSHELLAKFSYATYVCNLVDGVPNNIWRDVTASVGFTIYSESKDAFGTTIGKVVWNEAILNQQGLCPLIVIANNVISEEFDFASLGNNNDYFVYDLLKFGGISFASVDFIINGKSLIENIDYRIVDNKAYIYKLVSRQSPRKVKFIGVGLPNPATMKPYPPIETSFVKDGLLSVDGQYDLRKDRNIRINVAGRIYTKDEVCFSEDRLGPRLSDGYPYQIKDYVADVKPFTGKQTAPLLKDSHEIDDRVMSYLTIRKPESPIGQTSVTNQRWQIVSPFCNAILMRLKAGWLTTELQGNWDSSNVETWIDEVRYLLDIDPCVYGDLDINYVRVLPHASDTVMEVTPAQYALLKAIVRDYLNDLIVLSTTLSIKE